MSPVFDGMRYSAATAEVNDHAIPDLVAILSVSVLFLDGIRARSAPVPAPMPPVLINTCLITDDVGRLVTFYEPVLEMKAEITGRDYAEFHTGAGVLAIFSATAQESYIPHSTTGGGNRSVVLEFRVKDVDQEYNRLQGQVKTWVKPPTSQPWGTRSFYFRDPDGNLVDFFTRPWPQ